MLVPLLVERTFQLRLPFAGDDVVFLRIPLRSAAPTRVLALPPQLAFLSLELSPLVLVLFSLLILVPGLLQPHIGHVQHIQPVAFPVLAISFSAAIFESTQPSLDDADL